MKTKQIRIRHNDGIDEIKPMRRRLNLYATSLRRELLVAPQNGVHVVNPVPYHPHHISTRTKQRFQHPRIFSPESGYEKEASGITCGTRQDRLFNRA
jgi:hypothetical protein